jgi:hypothetical protein
MVKGHEEGERKERRKSDGKGRGEWRMGEGEGVEYYVMENCILGNFI